MKLLATIFLAAISTSALASEWYAYGSSPEFLLFFDRESVVKKDNSVTVWTKMIAMKPQKYDIHVISGKERIDCLERTSVKLANMTTDKSGKLLSKSETPYEKPGTIYPDTINESLLKVVCKKDFPQRVDPEVTVPAIDNDPEKTTELLKAAPKQ